MKSLAASPLDAIGLAFTSSAYKHGADGERRLIERLAPAARHLPMTSTCIAAAAALGLSGAQRIALVNPPWFDLALDRAGADYFRSQGFNVVHHAPCALPSGQKYITPQGLSDWVGEVVSLSNPDTVLIAGNGQRAVGIIETMEAQLDVMLLTANQLILWHALELAGHETNITGYGRLFSLNLPPADDRFAA